MSKLISVSLKNNSRQTYFPSIHFPVQQQSRHAVMIMAKIVPPNMTAIAYPSSFVRSFQLESPTPPKEFCIYCHVFFQLFSINQWLITTELTKQKAPSFYKIIYKILYLQLQLHCLQGTLHQGYEYGPWQGPRPGPWPRKLLQSVQSL